MKTPIIMEQEEQNAAETLKLPLACTLPFLRRGFNLMQNSMQPLCKTKLTPSSRACLNLLIRCSSAVRAITILCERGYALEAFGSAASLYESAWTIAYIGNDDSFGRRWQWHDDPNKSFGGDLNAVIKGGLKNLGRSYSKHSVDAEYELYRKLCTGKHINPLIQSYDAILEDEEMTLYIPGPGSDVHEVIKAWFVTLSAVEAMAPGIESFLKNQILPIYAKPLAQELNSILSDCKGQKNVLTEYLDEQAPKVDREYKNKFGAFRKLSSL